MTIRRTAVLASAAALAITLGTGQAAHAATVSVRVQVGSWRCPNGLYDVKRVDVSGVSVPSMSGLWTGSSTQPTVTITGVPAAGTVGHFVATYRCKVKVGPLVLPGYGEPAVADRWVYGSGTQPIAIL